jgi:hypothetical protein
VRDVLSELELTGVLPPIGSVNVTESAPVSAIAAPAPTATAAPAAAAAPHAPARDHRVEASLRHDISVRSAELDQREQAVRQRERELADQRRILAEEYRLLRSRTTTAPHTATAPPSVRVQVQAPLRAHNERPDSLWQRIRRMMPGASSPAME